MDGIAIDTTGNVSVRSLISHIMPQLHSASVLRSVRRAMKDSGGPDLTSSLIAGRLTKTATIDLCCLILDKMSGPTWDAWRDSSGPAFKQALRERVASIVAAGQVEQAHPPAQRAEEQRVDEQRVEEQPVEEQPVEEQRVEEQPVEEQPEQQEKKSVALRKALRAVNIDGSVRVDEPSGMVSDIDVIRMLCPDVNPNNAAFMLARVIKKDQDDVPQSVVGTPCHNATLADRVHHIKINGHGSVTPCSDAPTAIEIIWLLPGRAARAFRKQSAETIAHVLAGDVSLASEIEQRCTRLQSSEEGRAFQSIMLGEAPAKKHRSEPFWFGHISGEDQKAYALAEAKKAMLLVELDMHDACKEKMESVGQFAGRDEIEYADRVRDTQRRAAGAPALASAPDTSVGDQAIIVATAIDNSIDPETGLTIATHKVSASVRGPETSICVEATKLGISTGDKNGSIGKVAKRLYGVKYGEAANRDIPTRHTTFRGKPFVERTYFARDADLLQQAIRIVCCPPGEVSTS